MQKTYSGVTVDVNEEGYLTDHTQWNKDIALEIAKEEGIEELTPSHWQVLEYLQKYYKENKAMPSLRRVNKQSGVPTKELYKLYPEGPLKKSSKIAGLPKPASCV